MYSRNGDVFLATHAGAKLRRLASFPGSPARFPRWSPDSSRIRFTLSAKGLSRIWEIRPDGTGLHQYLSDWKPQVSNCCGDWTLDGRYFVFLADSKIWIAREDGGLFHRRTSAPSVLEIGPIVPRYVLPSLDGKRLFFVGGLTRTEYIRYEPTTGRFGSEWPGISEGQVEFSKDGKSISLISLLDQTLLKMAADGTQRVQLTSPPLRVGMARWSPDGGHTAFTGSYPGMQSRIYLLPAESAGGDDIDPSWSPDGASLAFASSSDVKPEERFIRVVNVNSGRVSVLAGSNGMWSPRWSPDGRWIAGLLGDEQKLTLYDLQTRQQTVLIHKESKWPNWSRDGKFLFCAADGGWWRVSIQNKKMDFLKPSQKIELALDAWFTLAPDGSILTAEDAGYSSVYALDWELP